ncbi:MAG TPA: hypothetical protein VGE57_12645 [Solimonas sp.]
MKPLRLALLASLLALSACSDGGGDEAAPPAPEPTPETQALAANCAWLLRSDPDLLNIAFPDEDAIYWVAAVPALPGTRLRIEGAFPQARYFSYNAYDALLRPTDALTDYQIDTDGGNPYRLANGSATRYVAYVEPGAVPEQRAPNTFYAGSLSLADRELVPNPVWVLIYRVYLPEGSRSGGVPLPSLHLEAAGQETPIALESCNPLPPQGLPSLLNQVIRDTDAPGLLNLLPFPLAPKTPNVVRFYGLPETARLLLGNAVGFDLPLQAVTAADTGGGFLSNVDNAYVTAMMSRERGTMYVVRARAPRHAQAPHEAPLGPAQVRYWSLCTNEFVTQRYVGCLSDFEVPLDREGYFTLVVSDPGERPLNATTEHGMAWLPWGAVFPDSVLIYRHMLPSTHFAEAVQNVPYGTPPIEVMGQYLPQVVYCDRATIESVDSGAAAFAACAR